MRLTRGRALRAMVDNPIGRVAIGHLTSRDPGRADQLAVLTYHRIGEPDDGLYPGLISATPSGFAEQIRWLTTENTVVSLRQVLERREGDEPLPPRSVLITFDDAYRDFATHAWPTLRAHGAAATLFVPTAFAGDPTRSFWWEDLHVALARTDRTRPLTTPFGRLPLATPADRRSAFERAKRSIKSLPHRDAMAIVDDLVDRLGGRRQIGRVLGWDELRSLRADGVDLGLHSRTHPLLDRLSVDDLTDEVAGARAEMERELASTFTAIAYPNGNYSPAVIQAVVAAGYRLGFTTERGTNRVGVTDWLTLKRINVGRTATRALLSAQLHRWFRWWP